MAFGKTHSAQHSLGVCSKFSQVCVYLLTQKSSEGWKPPLQRVTVTAPATNAPPGHQAKSVGIWVPQQNCTFQKPPWGTGHLPDKGGRLPRGGREALLRKGSSVCEWAEGWINPITRLGRAQASPRYVSLLRRFPEVSESTESPSSPGQRKTPNNNVNINTKDTKSGCAGNSICMKYARKSLASHHGWWKTDWALIVLLHE